MSTRSTRFLLFAFSAFSHCVVVVMVVIVGVVVLVLVLFVLLVLLLFVILVLLLLLVLRVLLVLPVLPVLSVLSALCVLSVLSVFPLPPLSFSFLFFSRSYLVLFKVSFASANRPGCWSTDYIISRLVFITYPNPLFIFFLFLTSCIAILCLCIERKENLFPASVLGAFFYSCSCLSSTIVLPAPSPTRLTRRSTLGADEATHCSDPTWPFTSPTSLRPNAYEPASFLGPQVLFFPFLSHVYTCIYICMYVCNVCMHACMHACMYVYYIYIPMH